MLKKLIVAIVVAILTTVGVVIPPHYVDKAVTFFVGDASAAMVVWDSKQRNYVSLATMPWQLTPYTFECGWCKCSPKVNVASGEALRPSLPHSSGNRFASSEALKTAELVLKPFNKWSQDDLKWSQDE